MTQGKTASIIAALIALAAAGCQTETPSGDPPALVQTASISDCGGFAEVTNEPELSDDRGYCEAEQLHWSYDPEARTLDLLDARILLNCCGDRDMSVELDDGVYVVTESDLPEGGEEGGRCNCMCVFDFALTIEDVADEVISVRLVRDSDGGASTLWEGALDLGDRRGVELIDDEDAGGWCQEPVEELQFSGEASECGGFDATEPPADGPGDEGYCDAEQLDWTYDEAAGTLSMTDNRVLLNCCGERDVAIAELDGVYVITETDGPEGGEAGARCDCLCVFDFALTASGIPAAPIDVRLMRHVTDSSDAPSLVWEGTLDLTLGAGAVTIDDEDVGPWCGME